MLVKEKAKNIDYSFIPENHFIQFNDNITKTDVLTLVKENSSELDKRSYDNSKYNANNSSNNQISIKYYKDGSEYKFDKYINKVLSSTKTWEGYICPNFDLKSSYYTINIPTKKCDTESEVIGELPNAWVDCMPNGGSRGIQGLGSFMDSNTLIITNDKDNKINWEVTTLASTEKQGTYILEDGEYLMMTDEGKNDLIIFSAGTKLTTKYYPDDSSLWTLNMTNELNELMFKEQKLKEAYELLGLISKNIILGAFSDANWKYLKFNSSKFFNVSEMNILNLVEGNTIKAVKLTSSSIANTFNSLDMMSYVIDGSPKSIESTNGIEWNIRTRLLLNVSPSNSQHLLSDYTITGTTKSEQRLGYTLKNSTTSTLSNCYINFNYPIYSVLDNISVKQLEKMLNCQIVIIHNNGETFVNELLGMANSIQRTFSSSNSS